MKKIPWILILLLWAVPSWAATYSVTCSGDITTTLQAAFTSASSANDIVSIGAGTCNLTNTVNWTAPANATLKGAGTTATGGGDQTVIQDNNSTSNSDIAIVVNGTGTLRVTGLTLQTGTGTAIKNSGLLVLSGEGTVRLDHLHFNVTNDYAVKVLTLWGKIYGVLDHSILDLYSTDGIFIYNFSGDSVGDSIFAADTSFGGADFFFIEDNIINGTPATHDTRLYDCMMAGKVVTRFNNFTASCVGETHDTGSAGETRGCRAQEVYGNYESYGSGQTTPNADFTQIGNGVALIWGNATATTESYQSVIKLSLTRQDPGGSPCPPYHCQTATPAGWGYCGTEYNGVGSAWDGNTPSAVYGYPCLDQPGRGKSDLLSGSFPNRVNTTTGTIAWPNQTLEPIYIWNNTLSPADGWGGSWYGNYATARIVADRDYYAQATGIQTNATTPFNGTSGTGWGTKANRPTTCTAGVGYWATDEGSWNTSTTNPYGVQQSGVDGNLYKCTATNTWTLYYTPYTYPHPLQGAAPATVYAPWRTP